MLLKNPVSDTSTHQTSCNPGGLNYMQIICIIWMGPENQMHNQSLNMSNFHFTDTTFSPTLNTAHGEVLKTQSTAGGTPLHIETRLYLWRCNKNKSIVIQDTRVQYVSAWDLWIFHIICESSIFFSRVRLRLTEHDIQNQTELKEVFFFSVFLSKTQKCLTKNILEFVGVDLICLGSTYSTGITCFQPCCSRSYYDKNKAYWWKILYSKYLYYTVF